MSPAEFADLVASAEAGDPAAQLRLGLCYERGDGVPLDYAFAVRWIAGAAEKGLAAAQCALGVRYAKGKGVDRDYATAGRWLRAAADQGDPRASFNLARLQMAGVVTELVAGEISQLLRYAATAGLPVAQLAYGMAMHVVARDREGREAAAQWIFAAAKNGLADAQYQLALMLAAGDGVERDPALAVEWLALAVAQDHVAAKLALGRYLASVPDGVASDPVRARRLLGEAAAAGLQDAIDALEMLGD